MARPAETIPEELRLSIQDLSMELESLGLKPIKKQHYDGFVQLSEALLSSAWMLVNLVHGRSMGFNDKHQVSDREALLHSEMQSVQSELEELKREVKVKDMALSSAREDMRQMDKKLLSQSEEIVKQKNISTQLMAKLQTQERDFRHDAIKRESEIEYLRNSIRKSLGVGRPQSFHVERLAGPINMLSVSDSDRNEVIQLHEATINRLKSTNQTLVGENLSLREALKTFHLDIQQILENRIKQQGDKFAVPTLPENIFALPLSYCTNKIKEIRNQQMSGLIGLLTPD